MMTDPCDIVPGSLGGHDSILWCRSHGRYAEAVAAERARIAEAVETEWYNGNFITRDLVLAIVNGEAESEMIRLRKIEEAAQMFVTVWRDDADRIPLTLDSTVAALRAALGEEAE